MKDFIFYVHAKRPYCITLMLGLFSLIFIRLTLENNVLVCIPRVIILITLCGLMLYYLSGLSKLIVFFLLSFCKTKAYCSQDVPSNSACPAEAGNLSQEVAVQPDVINLLHGLVPQEGNAVLLPGNLPRQAENLLPDSRIRVAVPASDISSATGGIPSDVILPDSFYHEGSAGTALLYGGLTLKYNPFLPVAQPDVQVYMLRHRVLDRLVYRGRVQEEPRVEEPIPDGVILAQYNNDFPDLLPPLFRAIMAPIVDNREGIVFTPAGIRHFLDYLRGVHAEFTRANFGRAVVVDEPYTDFFVRYVNIIGDRINVFHLTPDTLYTIFSEIIRLIKALSAIFRRNIYSLRDQILDGNMLQEFWDRRMLHIEGLIEHIDLVMVNPPVILFNDVLTLLLRFITREDLPIIQNLGNYLHTYPFLLLFGVLAGFQSVLTPRTFAHALPIFVFNLEQIFDGLRVALQPVRFDYRNFALVGNFVGRGFQQALFLGLGIFTLLFIGQNITLPNFTINFIIDNRQWRILVNPAPVEPAGEGVINIAFRFVIKTFKKIVRIRIIKR